MARDTYEDMMTKARIMENQASEMRTASNIVHASIIEGDIFLSGPAYLAYKDMKPHIETVFTNITIITNIISGLPFMTEPQQRKNMRGITAYIDHAMEANAVVWSRIREISNQRGWLIPRPPLNGMLVAANSEIIEATDIIKRFLGAINEFAYRYYGGR